MLAVGQFLSTFGVKGIIKFRSHSGDVGHLSAIKTFYSNTVHLSSEGTSSIRSYEIETWYIQSKLTIRCKIVGFDSPEGVRGFIGQNMYVPREQATQCEKGEYYIRDLIGMYIVHSGKVLGIVTTVFPDAYVPLLEVTMHHSAEKVYARNNKISNKSTSTKKLIPFMKKFVSDPLKVQKNCELVAECNSFYGIELYDPTLLE